VEVKREPVGAPAHAAGRSKSKEAAAAQALYRMTAPRRARFLAQSCTTLAS
jgi:hypothetical protein